MTERIRQGLGGLCLAGAVGLVSGFIALIGTDAAHDFAALGAMVALIAAVLSLVILADELLRGGAPE